MHTSRIEDVRWHQLRVSAKTVWSFVELVDVEGRIGVGEATLAQREPQMRQALQRFESSVRKQVPADVDLDSARSLATSMAEYAVVSALDQAVWDLVAQQDDVSVSTALGTRLRERIPVYANINRGIASRTEEGFAANACAAVADGFSAIKIAPFDAVELYGDSARVADTRLIDAGIARIAAVRDAIGPDVDLMVDCHWRLHRAAAEAVLKATEPHRLYWLECPVPETPEMFETLQHIRRIANAQGVRMAGCEQMSMRSGFAPFLDVGVYDAMMPDVKYVGGMREMLNVAGDLQRHGVAFSPHNPTGPVCHAASLHICAVASTLDRLELQYAETALFDELVSGAIARAVNGEVAVPRGTGLGVRLDRQLVRELADKEAAA